MQDFRQFYVHELSDMYSAEQLILKGLEKMANEAQDEQIGQLFQQHLQETQGQIQNLDRVFEALGAKPEQTTCYAMKGMLQEHDHFTDEKPSKEIHALFDLGAAEKVEHYEIASYQGLIEKAQLMGEEQIVKLLQENLQQEEATAKKVKQAGKKLAEQLVKQS